jgi:SAM-dependent methyltransferase
MSRLTKLRVLKWPTIAYEVQKNLRSRARGRRGALRAITAVGSTLGNPAERVTYSGNVFRGYLEVAGLTVDQLERMRVLELGPGEDLGTALRFLAAGASSVSCIDRFEFDVDPEWERAVYRALLDDVGDAGRVRLTELVASDGTVARQHPSLAVIRGVGIEAGDAHLRDRTYDLIVSVAVLEHVYDLEASLKSMNALLAPGGTMAHWVDLRDHGMFSGGGRHPLDFLTIPDPLYRLMTSHTGAPNRERVGRYRELLSALGHEATIWITNIGGARDDLDDAAEERIEVDGRLAESIEVLRPRMAPRFAKLSLEELATTGIVIQSVKPPAQD